MADAAQLQAWRDALEAVKYGGARRVTVDGRTIEYAPGPELDKAISDLDRRIQAAQGTQRPVARFATFRRGS